MMDFSHLDTCLYNLKTRPPRRGESKGVKYYTITKFDEDFNPTGDVYTLRSFPGGISCDCPGGRRPSCRHRTMLDLFEIAGAINQLKFYNFDTGKWVEP